MPPNPNPVSSNLGIIPQVYFDMIARFVPGLALLLAHLALATIYCGMAGYPFSERLQAIPGFDLLLGVALLVGPWLLGSALLVLAEPVFKKMGENFEISKSHRQKEIVVRSRNLQLGDRLVKRRAELRMWQGLAVGSVLTLLPLVISCLGREYSNRFVFAAFAVLVVAVRGVRHSAKGASEAIDRAYDATRFSTVP